MGVDDQNAAQAGEGDQADAKKSGAKDSKNATKLLAKIYLGRNSSTNKGKDKVAEN